MTGDIVCLNGFFKPEEICFFDTRCELNGFACVPFHIGINHEIGFLPDRLSDSEDSCYVFVEAVPSHFNLDTFEALFHKFYGLPNEFFLRKV